MSLDNAKCLIAYYSHKGKLCPHARILQGLAIHGSHVNDAKKDMVNWLDKASAVF